ncbi:MAG: aminomethyl-transferring glycine dehydrogenase subunit GcvPA [Acidaminococcaceae bacterium]|nr:aminomethyl-transferring glycine dehydrogenase subunit GcvPA [Acidaminococcaceae bacterium]
MGSYIPNTRAEREAMLREAGYGSFAELYADVPPGVLLPDGPAIPSGKSELAVRKELGRLAGRNKVYGTIFRGAGAYNHYIPAIVRNVAAKEEFITAYTPYQPEISQGVLQSIFEFQTMICELTALPVANASVYDGATATAEAIPMCIDRKRTKVLVSATVAPQVLEVVRTYCFGSGREVTVVPARDGLTDAEALQQALTDTTACFIMQQPNYFGLIEPAAALGSIAHGAGAKFVMNCNPTALALLAAPGECGADVAVGEGQPLGLPLSFGGPYVGYMAATQAMMRKLPGRIVGQTHDAAGHRAFVLTLQAREQHIRREKASSNICTNQSLCTLMVSAYLSAVGPDGLKEVASQCTAKAHYLQAELEKAGLARKYAGEFFHEFVTKGGDADKILAALDAEGILGGLPLAGDEILWCCTELCAKEDMDKAAAIVRTVQGGGR